MASVNKASIDMAGRRCSNVVAHRRPFWAKTEKSRSIYIDNPPKRSPLASPAYDARIDNFSYDPDHLKQWALPAGLLEKLPTELREKLDDWQKAGAAVCTALDRIEDTLKNAMYYAHPPHKTNHPIFGRTPEMPTVAGAGAVTPPMSLPVSPTAMPTVSVKELEKNALITSLEQYQASKPMGMESPPFTPIDSAGCGTPVIEGQKPINALPDLAKLHRELTPSSSPDALTPVSSSTPGFDENSWEFYLKRYKIEWDDNKLALSRFKGYGKQIEILRREMWRRQAEEEKMVVITFTYWWENVQSKVREVESRVKEDLQWPELDMVQFNWEYERDVSLGKKPNTVLDRSATHIV